MACIRWDSLWWVEYAQNVSSTLPPIPSAATYCVHDRGHVPAKPLLVASASLPSAVNLYAGIYPKSKAFQKLNNTLFGVFERVLCCYYRLSCGPDSRLWNRFRNPQPHRHKSSLLPGLHDFCQLHSLGYHTSSTLDKILSQMALSQQTHQTHTQAFLRVQKKERSG